MRVVSSLLLASLVQAQAGMGTTFSGPTDGDGTSPYWNPAAMNQVAGTQLDGGFGLALIRLAFHPEGSAAQSDSLIPKPEPSGGIVGHVGRQFSVGLSFGVPYVDGAGWPRDGGASDITRFYMVKSALYHMTLTPAVSYRPIPAVAFGAGIDIVRSRMEAELDKDFGHQLNVAAGSPDAKGPFPVGDSAFAGPVKLDVTGWSVGWVAGVLLRPTSAFSLGASFHAAATADAWGQVEAEPPDALTKALNEALPAAKLPPLRARVHSRLTLPMTVLAAAAVQPFPRWELRADYRYNQRSQASRVDVNVVETTSPDLHSQSSILTYTNRHNVGGRVSRKFRWGQGHLANAAAQIRYEPGTIPDSVFTPMHMDFSKWELGVALASQVGSGLTVVAEYSHFFVESRSVDQSVFRPLADPALDAFSGPSPYGKYDAIADRLGVGLSLQL